MMADAVYKSEDVNTFMKKPQRNIISKLDRSSLGKIQQWEDVKYSIVDVPIIHADISVNKIRLSIAEDVDVDYGFISQNVAEVVNRINKKHKSTPKDVLFNENLDPMAIRFAYDSNYFVPDDTELSDKWWNELTLKNLKALADQEGTIHFVWTLGNSMFTAHNQFCPEPLSVIMLEDYCDTAIPTGYLLDEDMPQDKLSRDGFYFLMTYSGKLVWGDSRISNSKKLLDIYDEYDDNNLIPRIPVRWNDDEREFLNLDRLYEAVNKYKKERVEEEEKDKKALPVVVNDDESNFVNSALEVVNHVLSSQINKVIDVNSNDQDLNIKLSEVLTLDFWESEPVLDGTAFTNEFILEVDCGVNAGVAQLDKEDIAISMIAYGMLNMVVPEGIKDAEQLRSIEENIEATYGMATVIFESNEVEHIKQAFFPMLKEAENDG